VRFWIVAFIPILVSLSACGGTSDSQSSTTAPLTPTAVAQPGTSGGIEPLPGDWITDFRKASISREELTQGQIKDGIPAISEPRFLSVPEVDFLGEQEPVVAFQQGDDVRAYPLQIMTWHEIVNDVVDGRPVLITFCPLCNTAIAFDRTVNGHVLEFGVSGFLRKSDLVMFDRASESFWQQITGEALVGQFTGTKLDVLPSSIVAWSDFRETFPEGKVLSRRTGFNRPYGNNPYEGYDDVNSSPFLFRGDTDGRLAAMERVVTVEIEGDVAAYPFSRLEANPVVNDSVGGEAIVVFFKPGTASALDLSSIADSRDVGSGTAFSPIVGGRTLSFSSDGDTFKDAETGSTWDIFGKASAGELQGKTLTPIVSGNHFWFAWAAFKPETRVWDGS
jgi:hypothetical protein